MSDTLGNLENAIEILPQDHIYIKHKKTTCEKIKEHIDIKTITIIVMMIIIIILFLVISLK